MIGTAAEILAIFDQNNHANAKGKIAAVFMGHEGRNSSFRDNVPEEVAIRFPAKISGQQVQLNG